MSNIAKGYFKDFNNYEVRGDITIIFIETRKGIKFETIIDTEELSRLTEINYSWHIQWNAFTRSYYVSATKHLGNGKTIPVKLADFIMNAPPKQIVDHINHNTLDNRKINLRFVTKSQNAQHRKGANINSKTGVRNVSYIEKHNVYWVQFCKNYKRYKWVFSADKFEEACKFAEEKRKEIFGEFKGKG